MELKFILLTGRIKLSEVTQILCVNKKSMIKGMGELLESYKKF